MEPKSDKENLIEENGKDKEKEALNETTEEGPPIDVSEENFTEVDKMMKELENYA